MGTKQLNNQELGFNAAQLSDVLFGIYKNMISKDRERDFKDQIVGCDKNSGDNKGQWGYIANPNIESIKDFMISKNLTSIADLGCGNGMLLFILSLYRYIGNPSRFTKPFINTFKGFEIEKELIEDGRKMFRLGDLVQKDILTLTKKDIEGIELIYFWEPLHERTLAKKFVKNLAKIVSEDQYIYCVPSGSIVDYLRQNFNEIEEQNTYRGGVIFKGKKENEIKLT